MCECQHECSKEEFIYGIDEIPCWFKRYKYTEVGFGNFHVCYLYIKDNALEIRAGEVIKRKDLELL